MTEENKPQYFKQSDDDLIPMNVVDVEEKIELSAALQKHLNDWNQRYPQDKKASGVFEALRCVQEENGGTLTPPLMDAVAAFLGMSKIAVYEVAAFYTMYKLNPVGHHVIGVCTNISCELNGVHKILEHLKKRLGIDLHETTADGRFTLEEVECLGACIAPPVCMIGKKYYENLTIEKMDEILMEFSK